MRANLYQSAINTYYNINHIKNELINIERKIDSFNMLIENNDIEFNEYIDIINKIYNIEITDNDLIKISSYILGNNAKVVILNTDILQNVVETIQIGNYFKYNNKPYKLSVKVAFNDALIDLNHIYSYEELSKIDNKGEIVILNFIVHDSYCDDITYFKKLRKLENCFVNFKYVKEEYKPSIYAFLKEYFSPTKVKNDFNNYMNDIIFRLDCLDKYIFKISRNSCFINDELDNLLLSCKRIKQRKISKE